MELTLNVVSKLLVLKEKLQTKVLHILMVSITMFHLLVVMEQEQHFLVQ